MEIKVHIDATLRIRLNNPCAAATRPRVKYRIDLDGTLLLPPFVRTDTNHLKTHLFQF